MIDRVRSVRARHLFVAGVLIGLIVASTTTIVSARRYAEPAIYLLGSGNALSALIVSESSRVLIANGNDPAALANAFGRARPDALRRIDLVILMPDATERLAERAVNLASPARVLALPNDRFHPGNRIDGRSIRPIDGLSSIQLGDNVSLTIDPGADLGWTIELSIDRAVIHVVEVVPMITPVDVDLLIIAGSPVGAAIGALTIPYIAPEVARPGEQFSGHTHLVSSVRPNLVTSINIRNGTIFVKP